MKVLPGYYNHIVSITLLAFIQFHLCGGQIQPPDPRLPLIVSYNLGKKASLLKVFSIFVDSNAALFYLKRSINTRNN
ncbi:hypothetical protein SAMN02745131_01072 [Flavisolibacter ginsengisoli DSM 18119]|jgi:hypothetical protein|uniref:Uncharacterized protein n=1 Tax=Flavisolibacter ginsengisoli DSM 18119 TaxID=1121884 RepID=A0A1M4W3A1_9BACT|nr:hypothetical protein SAMN02745131_01072 [Flavisolibacter ginsengisoli DSM 18119]